MSLFPRPRAVRTPAAPSQVRPPVGRPRTARRPAPPLAILFLASLAFVGCSKDSPIPLGPNTRPTLELTQAPISTTQPFFYSYELRWAGFDVDGHIDYFRYAIDPPTAANSDTAWVKTTENRKAFLFHADQVDNSTDQTAEGFHTIALEAVDDRGAISVPVTRSFTSFTIAPTVQIINPVPNHLLPPTFGPSFRLTWRGSDPDGRGTTRPVQYKFKLFREGSREFDFITLLVNPDSLRRRYAPRFSEWDSVGGDTTSFDFRDMVPKQKYVAVVIAFDEVGAYSPVMNYDVNMLYFTVDYAGLLGPKMSVFNESFFYTYGSGGFSLDPNSFIRTESPSDRPVRFGWSAATSAGTYVAGYRWMLDGNVGDETARTDENAEFYRWSQLSPLTTAVDLPAFHPISISETHYLYIEAVDNNKQVSLAVVQFAVVRPVFDRDLLIVDDTRVQGDHPGTGGCVDRPRGVWPTAAELDTHFFARGNKPWRCYPNGMLSPVGIFQGYAFDTLGTRFLPQGTLTLQALAHYRHVVWYTDFKASLNVADPYITGDPMSELRWLTIAGRTNPLGTWVTQGGQLWMFGGGVASSLQRNFEKLAPADIYSSADGELGPGRFMYDVFRWRSEITARSFVQATKPDHPIGRSADSPDYSALPDYLFYKDAESDPMAGYVHPQRSYSEFYQSAQVGEGLSKSNEILEDRDPDPAITRLESVVDTVYESVGGQMGSGRPVMTVWHGGDGTQKQVFSGFQLWYWQRRDQITIVDWVLRTLWGIPRKDVPR